MSQRNSTQTARAALQRAGYQRVEVEPRLAGINAKSIRPDVVAWAADRAGKLVPWAVVEVKTTKMTTPPELALVSLARCRDVLGTVEHYAVINDDWYRADAGLRRMERVNGPESPAFGGAGRITDVDLATRYLTEQLWRWADQQRTDRHRGAGITWHLAAFPLTLDPNFDQMPIDPEVRWEAQRRAYADFVRRDRAAGEYSSHPVVAAAVVALAGDRIEEEVFDPFVGTGSFLWEAIDAPIVRAADDDTLSVRGWDINEELVRVARLLATGAAAQVEIEMRDAFGANWPSVSCILSAPPFGLRLRESHELLDGTVTHDSDLVVIDRALRALQTGGRVVLHLPLGFTFRTNASHYRDFLAGTFRVGAILGLPSGAVAGTSVRSLLLVIDKASATRTFVAQLGEDWEVQIGVEGPALVAAVAHLESISEAI